jgi:hypothetical protein
MPAVGRGAPKCCRSCLGRLPAKKPRGEDRAGALPIFTGPPSIDKLFGPTGGGITTKTHRTAHAGGGGGEAKPPSVTGVVWGAEWRKTQGRCQGGSPADFLLGPQASTELVSPPEGQIKGSTGRSGSAADLLRGPHASTGSTGGKLQGKTGQGVSAADFFPASRTSSKPSVTTRSARRHCSAHRDETRWLTEPRAHSPRPPAPTPHDGKATGERRRRRRR